MIILIVLLSLLVVSPLCAQERAQARAMVITAQGVVSTSQTLASQAGAVILARGGSAVDAAIAANAVLGVTEPAFCGMGGDLFVIYWDARSGRLTGLNASGWTPKDFTVEFLKKNGLRRIPSSGIHSATIPGCVAGWDRLHRRYGKLPWRVLFDSAIFYARQGFPLTEMFAAEWRGHPPGDSRFAEERRVFFPQGRAPQMGEIFRNPDLAHAYELVAHGGADTFYRGALARALLATSQRYGGSMQASDLAEFSPEWVEPISTNYRGWKVYELPPNGQGVAALLMLNILSQLPVAPAPQSADDLHRKIEATKLAYADLGPNVADPRFYEPPMARLLSLGYAAERARSIAQFSAACAVSSGVPQDDTTYVAVVDREGNIVSWIQSLSGFFGSGVVVDGMGFALHNRANFTLDPNHPNTLTGRKRPFHTIIPGFMERENLHIGFGIIGGPNQPQAHAQFVSNIADYGMNIQAALEAPRFKVLDNCSVIVEGRIKPEVQETLANRGHKLRVRAEYSFDVGFGEAVLHDSKSKVNYGASSPQGDGAAVPEPTPPAGRHPPN